MSDNLTWSVHIILCDRARAVAFGFTSAGARAREPGGGSYGAGVNLVYTLECQGSRHGNMAGLHHGRGHT